MSHDCKAAYIYIYISESVILLDLKLEHCFVQDGR